MREYKYDHTIHPMNSTQVFKEFCGLIQKSYPDYQQKELLVDVDGSTA